MADSISLRGIDEVRAAILAQVIRRDYLEELVKKAKSMESNYGSDYPKEMSKAFQDILTKETHDRSADTHSNFGTCLTGKCEVMRR